MCVLSSKRKFTSIWYYSITIPFNTFKCNLIYNGVRNEEQLFQSAMLSWIWFPLVFGVCDLQHMRCLFSRLILCHTLAFYSLGGFNSISPFLPYPFVHWFISVMRHTFFPFCLELMAGMPGIDNHEHVLHLGAGFLDTSQASNLHIATRLFN